MSERKFVKIMLTTEMLETIFRNGERHFKVENGLEEGFKFVGIVQDDSRCMSHLFFKKGEVVEGTAAYPITPKFTELRKKESDINEDD